MADIEQLRKEVARLKREADQAGTEYREATERHERARLQASRIEDRLSARWDELRLELRKIETELARAERARDNH